MNTDEGLYMLYHNDFRSLNGKLLDYYGCADEFRNILSNLSPVLDLEEVHSKDVENFVPFAFEDLEYKSEGLAESLNVFTFDQIVGYIETSVDLGILKTKSILQSIF